MTEDIAPGLLFKIQKSVEAEIAKSKRMQSLMSKMEKGTATLIDANTYSKEVGYAISNSLKRYCRSDILPDGKMYYNIAKRVLDPILKDGHDKVTSYAQVVQQRVLIGAKSRLKATESKVNQDRIDGFINRVSDAESVDDIKWIFDEPIRNYTQSCLSDSMEANLQTQGRAGIRAIISRVEGDGGCCKWCQDLAGEYEWGDHPDDIFAHHDNCNCIVTYKQEGGSYSDVYSKREYDRAADVRKSQAEYWEQFKGMNEKQRRDYRAEQANARHRITYHRKRGHDVELMEAKYNMKKK